MVDTSTNRAMPLSRSKHSCRSPISGVPCDVLREIFIHCLPRHPLEIRQPNTTIAPMLLCQICSSWRTVALTSPTLWSHLSYHVHLHHDMVFKGWSEPSNIRVLKNEIDFIHWWKAKQGLMAPFLFIDVSYTGTSEPSDSCLLPADGLTALLEYIMTAQYLRIENLWEILAGEISGDVRRLSIDSIAVYDPSPNRIPSHWSCGALTHLSLRNIILPLKFWTSLIRAVPGLQWACIEFDCVFDAMDDTKPTEHILPQLSTLFVGVRPGSDANFKPGLLLAGLQLPALHTLSLLSCRRMERERIPDIHTILQSTPVITTLALRAHGFWDEDGYSTGTKEIAVQPIWSCTPHLSNIQFELPRRLPNGHAKTMEEIDAFVHDALFSDMCWLCLDVPACPIRTITLIDMVPSNEHFKRTKDLVMASIRKRAGGAPNTTFNVIPKSEDVPVAEILEGWEARA
ncbi:hypothetical protein BJ912DRAFT_385412 [Pholiota molesta]|nr:hypothetical protein BJ912DRAFT_385412 [Pholiota molesta]